jgi:CHAD domain-containing protein
MEIEAKFSVSDRATFDRLRQLTELAGYRLEWVGVKRIHDRYLDTKDRAILRAGYACRVRHKRSDPEAVEEENYVATLKGLGGADANSGIHQRTEYEVQVHNGDPMMWPESPARDLVLRLSGGQQLYELCSLRQERHTCLLYADGQEGKRRVAELSLDIVVSGADRSQCCYELELELLDQGSESDLRVLGATLRKAWGLRPEPRSKFERALELIDIAANDGSGETVMEGPLTGEERATLQTWLERGNRPEQRRARIILLHDEGCGTSVIAREVSLSQRQVRRWLAAFRATRMGVFRASVGEGHPKQESLVEQTGPLPVMEAGTEVPYIRLDEAVQPAPLTVEELCARNGVDSEGAEYIRNLALKLFDLTAAVHGLSSHRKVLLDAAATLHSLGLAQDHDQYHLVGRDLIMAQPIVGFGGAEQAMLASVVAFHRKKVRRQQEKAFVQLPAAFQEETLALAALLRMAAALDASETRSTSVSRAETQDRQITFVVEGPMAEQDGAAAQRRSDLWDQLFDVGLSFVTEKQLEVVPAIIDLNAERLELPELTSPGLLPDDPMSEAGRKTLLFHFLRMLEHEPGTRLGEDIEELHDMRVATRRMRAAIQVFGDFFAPEAIRPFNKAIRRVTRALGSVRDLDVFEEKAARYLATLPEEARDGLDPLLETWHAQREAGRENMVAFLESERHIRFKREFAEFLRTRGAGAQPVFADRPVPYQVRHVAPRLIYTRFETVRAYETVLDAAQVETLHALRIDCKYLRYTLEFLREVMGPQGEAVIEEVKAMQDHLGDLNDAEVAISLLNAFLSNWGAAQAHVPLSQRRSSEGIVTYLASRHAEKHRLLVTFPEAWNRLNREEVRRWLALAVAAL